MSAIRPDVFLHARDAQDYLLQGTDPLDLAQLQVLHWTNESRYLRGEEDPWVVVVLDVGSILGVTTGR